MTVKLVRRCLTVVALLVLAGGNMFGALVQCSTLSTLQDYVNQGTAGCADGDKIFSNFALNFTESHGTGAGSPYLPAATDVLVTTIGNYVGNDLGLEFDFYSQPGSTHGVSVAYNQAMSLNIQYLVTVTTTPWAITSVYTEAYGGNDKGTGESVTAAKNLCAGAAFTVTGNFATNTCPGGIGMFGVSPTGSFTLGAYPNDVSGTRSIAAQTVLGVSDYITLTGSTTTVTGSQKTAEFETIINDFVQTRQQTGVPEPATFLLLGSALLGLGVLRRKSV